MSVRSSDVFRSTIHGHLGPCVFIDLVLKLILLSAPILRDEASVNRREWSNITRAIKYNRKNIGIDSRISTSAALVAFHQLHCHVIEVTGGQMGSNDSKNAYVSL